MDIRLCEHCLNPACVRRIRSLDILRYDADRIEEVASNADEQDLYHR